MYFNIFKKIKIFFTMLLFIPLLCNAFEINNQEIDNKLLEQKKEKILKIFHQALEDFNISKNSITIKFVTIKNKEAAANANDLIKLIRINLNHFSNDEFNNEEFEAYWKFTAYHEVGHLVDKPVRKLLAINLISLFLIDNGLELIHKLLKPIIEIKKFKNIIIFLLALKLSYKLSYENVNLLENMEHRANTLACEKLIEKKDIIPIIYSLISLRNIVFIGSYKHLKDGAHNYYDQFFRMESMLRNHYGFEIIYEDNLILKNSKQKIIERKVTFKKDGIEYSAKKQFIS